MPKNQFQRPIPVIGRGKASHGGKPFPQHKTQPRQVRPDNAAVPALPTLDVLLGRTGRQ
jgi:hypothetical protein